VVLDGIDGPTLIDRPTGCDPAGDPTELVDLGDRRMF
jgi:hypothetical protein